MGNLVLAAKITHVPTIWMSHTIEKYKGLRTSALDGYEKLRQAAIAAKVDTFIVIDTHWIVNQGFHLNAKPRHEGNFISHELPHILSDLAYDYHGNPELGALIVDEVRADGHRALAHDHPDLGVEYGTLLPMYFINKGVNARVLPIAANQFSTIDENRQFGAAIRRAIDKSEGNVALFASGSLSHAFWENSKSVEGVNKVNGAFNEQTDHHVLELWENGDWSAFLDMLPDYAVRCVGECGMVDTAMLFGALGWKDYGGSITTMTPYFGSSGTGQVNITFSV